jgi:hypothetical protein
VIVGAGLIPLCAPPLFSQGRPAPDIVVVTAVTRDGRSTDDWLAILRSRLDTAQYDSVAALRKLLAPEEASWDSLIRARQPAWLGFAAPIASLYSPAEPPPVVRIILGNRGGEDAFTADPHTIGFDLSRLFALYGASNDAANALRIDRLFRHEFSHILQKAWLTAHPWPIKSPLDAALFDIWTEGLGNYYSLSSQWVDSSGKLTSRAREVLTALEPRFASNLRSLACADSATAAPLLATLSSGPFDRKWGALPAALWLATEAAPVDSALRRFIVAGPGGVWDLAAGHIAPEVGNSLQDAKRARSHCRQ